MLTHGTVFGKSPEGISVFKTPYDYLLHSVNAVAVNIVLKHHAVVVAGNTLGYVLEYSLSRLCTACVV